MDYGSVSVKMMQAAESSRELSVLASVTDEHGEVVGQVGLSGNLRIATISSEAMAQHVAAKRSLTIEVWNTGDRNRSV
ncbi:MAG: hypothetical protein ACD_10C00138G0002 [uncultured bacterium]|nr:MAG: hypothetical protein ACD_10C00138G0002 [uncultured bacterium]